MGIETLPLELGVSIGLSLELREDLKLREGVDILLKLHSNLYSNLNQELDWDVAGGLES